MKWYEIAKIVFLLVPAIMDIVYKVEQMIPEPGQGSAKLTMIREMVVSIHKDAVTLWPMLETMISIIVSTFNSLGIFKKEAA